MSDWSSDVCSSDLSDARFGKEVFPSAPHWGSLPVNDPGIAGQFLPRGQCIASVDKRMVCSCDHHQRVIEQPFLFNTFSRAGIGQCSNEKIEIPLAKLFRQSFLLRSEAHTSELQSHMRISYDVLCLQTKNK